MGRARKNQEERQPYSIRLSLYEHALWEQKAEQAGMSMSNYFRHLLLTGGVVDGNAAGDRRKLLWEISAIDKYQPDSEVGKYQQVYPVIGIEGGMGLPEGNPGIGQQGISHLEGWRYGAGNQSKHGENVKTGILPIINICRIKTI